MHHYQQFVYLYICLAFHLAVATDCRAFLVRLLRNEHYVCVVIGCQTGSKANSQRCDLMACMEALLEYLCCENYSAPTRSILS